MDERPWWTEWKVWASMGLLMAITVGRWLVGTPLRLLRGLWEIVIG